MGRNSVKRRAAGAIALLAVAAGVAYGVGAVATQEAVLVALDAQGSDFLGESGGGEAGGGAGGRGRAGPLVRGVSVAVDGPTAVAGAYGANSSAGAAYVFSRSGTTWTQQAKLTDAGTLVQFFGYRVAISGDTIVVGAFATNFSEGAAFVFRRSGTVWTEEAKLLSADASFHGQFGVSVAISGDTIVVGADGQDPDSHGAAYVFTRSGTTWTQQAKLTASDPDVSGLGISVALSGDTVLAGVLFGDPSIGPVFVFTRTGTTWSQQARLAAADSADDDRFGTAVAIDGDTAASSAIARSSGRGAVYVFERNGTAWTQDVRLTLSGGQPGDYMGQAIAIEGTNVIVNKSEQPTRPGAAFVFTRTGTTWSERARLTPSDAVDGDGFGTSVALSGGRAVVGAYTRDAMRGAAYVFDLPSGAGPPLGYCLASKVTAKANAAHPEKSTLTASGTLDTGSGAPDFTGAASFDVGGFHLDIPEFVAKGKSIGYSAGGISLKITPAKSGSSNARFSVKVVGDLTGKVGRDLPVRLHFMNTAVDLHGTAKLTAGALAPRGVTGPNLALLSAAATIKGGGADALKLTLTFATDGVAPPVGEDLTVCFGDTYTSPTLLGGSFVRKGSAYVRTAKAPGITKAVVDYAKGTITIAAKGIDLGAFAAGGNPIVVTVVRGTDTRSARVRMSLAGTKFSY